MKQFYIIILLFLFCENLFSQKIAIDGNKDDKKKIESIILQNKNFGKDTIALKSYLDPLIKSSDKNLHAVYYNILGSGFASANEKLNQSSDLFFAKSIEIAKANKNSGLEIWALCNYAFYLYDYKKTTEALQVYLDADNKIRHTEINSVILPSDCFKKIGYFMGTIGDKNEAINYLKKAEQRAEPNSKELAAIMDNIGYYFLELNQLHNAEKYIIGARDISLKINDQIRYPKTLGNLGFLELKKGNLDKAETYVKQDLKISTDLHSDHNSSFARFLLSKILIENNKIEEAKKMFNEAEKFAESKVHLKKMFFKLKN